MRAVVPPVLPAGVPLVTLELPPPPTTVEGIVPEVLPPVATDDRTAADAFCR